MTDPPGRRSSRLLASLIVLGALGLAWPASAAAFGVTFEPPQGRPGSTVSIPGGVCGYAGDVDQVWFSDRYVAQSPDSIYYVEPAATATLTAVGGELTEWGIFNATAQTFVVPRLPAGDYYLYAACQDASACCVPLEPTFHVLGTPDTSTEESPAPEATLTPAPSPEPTPEATATPDPRLPTPDPSRAFVSAWSVVRNPEPEQGGPWLYLSGRRFAATFDGARVVRSSPFTEVTTESTNAAFWEIEFTDEGPVQAVLTLVPQGNARLLEVRCMWSTDAEIEQHSFPASLEGNSVSFDVVRGADYPRNYECFYVLSAGGTAPPTDMTASAAAGSSPWEGRVVLVVLVGLVAGVLILNSSRFDHYRVRE